MLKTTLILNKMHTIKWGIIGCGDVAEVKSGPAFYKVPNSELIAVMRRNGEKAKDFAKRHKVPYWYNKVEDLLANPAINAVYIATPPSSHFEIVQKCLAANKFIYLEKPITIDYKEALELQKIITSQHKIVVAHYRRNLPAFLKVKALLDEKVLGKIHSVNIDLMQAAQTETKIITKTEDHWRLQPEISGGGYFNDIAPHQIDLMYYYFGDIVNAKGFSTAHSKNNVADVVSGILEFKNGILFKGTWNFVASKNEVKDECKIYGEKGSITFSFFGDRVLLDTTEQQEVFKFKNPPHLQQPMIAQTVQYFLGKAQNPCSIENGVFVMKIIDSFTK